jgi:hypothetical protein
MKLYLEKLYAENFFEKEKNKIKAKYAEKKKELRERKKNIIAKYKQKLIDLKNKKTWLNFSKEQVDEEVADKVNQRIYERINQIANYFTEEIELLEVAETAELKKLEDAKELFSKSKKVAAAVIISALIITYANSVYRERKKLIRKKCSKYTGEKYKKCLKIQKVVSLKKRLEVLNKETFRCNKSTDPVECKARVHKYALKIRDKILNYAEDIGVINLS